MLTTREKTLVSLILLAINSEYWDPKSKINIEGSGPYALLYSKYKNELDIAYNNLKKINEVQVYKKNEIPKDWHFSNHYRIKDLLVIAKEGWTILEPDHGISNSFSKGNHGYDNRLKSMEAIFFAQGPSFKKNYTTEVIDNIDIYPLIAHILKIKPYTGIDGKLENVLNLLID